MIMSFFVTLYLKKYMHDIESNAKLQVCVLEMSVKAKFLLAEYLTLFHHNISLYQACLKAPGSLG
jgi:hypothetical protein